MINPIKLTEDCTLIFNESGAIVEKKKSFDENSSNIEKIVKEVKEKFSLRGKICHNLDTEMSFITSLIKWLHQR